MTAFQDSLRQASRASEPVDRRDAEGDREHRVGDRFGRVEPRANKRRPKRQRYLKEAQEGSTQAVAA